MSGDISKRPTLFFARFGLPSHLSKRLVASPPPLSRWGKFGGLKKVANIAIIEATFCAFEDGDAIMRCLDLQLSSVGEVMPP